MDSRVYLQTARRNGCTRVEDVFCTAPYKIMRPFLRGGCANVMVMAASAGLLAGDTLDAEYRFEDGSNVAVYTQGYEKVFNTGEGHVTRHTRLSVGEGAHVRFLPQPVIPFAGSDLRSETQVELAKNCRFAYAEIVACGRTGRGERFQLRRLDSRLQVAVDGRLAFAEHTRLEPSCMDHTGLGQWQGMTHQGLLYVYGPAWEGRVLEAARQTKALPGGLVGASRAVCGVCVRALATSGDSVYRLFCTLAAYMEE